jgi:hypothetical protein
MEDPELTPRAPFQNVLNLLDKFSHFYDKVVSHTWVIARLDLSAYGKQPSHES